MFYPRRGKNTVTEVEDVTRPSRRARQHIVGRRKNAVKGTEEQRRVEIALDGAIAADSPPRLVERDAPIGADDGAAGLPDFAENRAPAAPLRERGATRPGCPSRRLPGFRGESPPCRRRSGSSAPPTRPRWPRAV